METQKCCVATLLMMMMVMMRAVPGCQCVPMVSGKSSKSDPEAFKRNEGISAQRAQPFPEMTEATAFSRRQDCVIQVPVGDWTTIRFGEGQCDITEACVERMRAGETSEILISTVPNGSGVSITKAAKENLPLRATVELRAFTPGKESWEMTLCEKWGWVKSHKEKGGVRFRSGDVWGAADSYSRALKLVITIHGHVGMVNAQGQNPDTVSLDSGDQTRLPSADEVRTTKAELHSNMSLCQLKLNQPERARTSASKATQLEPGGAKGWYRLGQACQMINELEEARQAFKKLLELQPESPAALKALKNIASKEKETNALMGLRLSKMFS
ncbi:hypothetical protein D4764_08G0006820 [Takifugu flavidus]|uniref:Uncharacterized protein n=1 Tax=Takifugu flavidus TaxID=433684 RepID=A0A5C6MPM7_9TELE|nr:hypothetical protein D4764_08G0006820 [Takifugu flavidus]